MDIKEFKAHFTESTRILEILMRTNALLNHPCLIARGNQIFYFGLKFKWSWNVNKNNHLAICYRENRAKLNRLKLNKRSESQPKNHHDRFTLVTPEKNTISITFNFLENRDDFDL